MSKLVIVESPGKLDALRGYLGAGYEVAASYGHVRDLPASSEKTDELVAGIGRDYRPRYVATDKGKGRLARLRELAAKADSVLLATDPDREGEAIAWHLKDALRLRNTQRITFNEISRTAVTAAVASARSLDMDLVQAQEARRVLDRMVGYAVSPVLSKQSGQKLSAGRVQSPALRLVVDREREIRAFRERRHFGAELSFEGGWTAQWLVKHHLADGEEYWLGAEAADRIAQTRELVVGDYEDGTAREAPAAPFTTSTFQQEASKRLGLKPKEAMAAAQALFDKGAITYHRTDSPNISAEGQQKLCAFAEGEGLRVVDKPRHWKSKAGSQEAHEAIRPVDVAIPEAGGTDVERRVYALIRSRALAAVLPDAEYATRKVVLSATGPETVAGVTPRFEGRGRVLTEAGWRVAYGGETRDEGEEQSADEAALSNPIPELEIGASVIAQGGRRLDKKTKPPRRYTEAGLVKALEERGIGRPSTYAAIIDNITSRSYVVAADAKGKFLEPTATGEALVDALVSKCAFIEYEFTATLEDELDEVAGGKRSYDAVVNAAWRQLSSELDGLQVAIKPEHPCPECGKALARRKGSNGFFWGCTGYPDCKVTAPDNRGKPGERKAPPAPTGFHCEKQGCGKPLARRQGKSKAKKGQKGREYDFFGCTGYPKCDATYQTGPDGKPVFGG